MSLKRRLDALAASVPDPAQMCCLDLERAKVYADLVHERFVKGPMSETPEFLPVCLKDSTPCPQGQRYGCAVWRNISRLEHLRNYPDDNGDNNHA